LANRRSGAPRICGEDRTVSLCSVRFYYYYYYSSFSLSLSSASLQGERKKRTEDFPAFAETLAVDRVNDVDDGMAIIIIFGPDGPDPALSAEVPEL
jgi:hypothetical protein